MDIWISSIGQGILWSVMAIGVYLTYRILDIPDLTAEGSFPLGAAVTATSITCGYSPLLATLFGFLAGACAGGVSGFMHTKMKIPALLTGILTLTGLYSINLRIMGQSNIPLIGRETVMHLLAQFNLSATVATLGVALITVCLLIIAIKFFFDTEIGLAIRATGDNEAMSIANGIKTNRAKIVTYMISNGLIALSGSLLCQNNGYADISMGTGTIVIGLASVIIAEVLIHQLTLVKRCVTIVFGAILYRLVIDFIMQQSVVPVTPTDIKLISAIALAIILFSPEAKVKLKALKKGA